MHQSAPEPDTRAPEETISDRRREGRAKRIRAVRRYAGVTLAVAFLFGIGVAASAGHDMVVLAVESLALLAAAAAAFVVAFAPGRGGRAEIARAHANAAERARRRRRRTAARRFASSLALVALFAAGASLSAAGGDVLIPGITGTEESTSTDTDTTGTTETVPATTETPADGGAPPPSPPAAPPAPPQAPVVPETPVVPQTPAAPQTPGADADAGKGSGGSGTGTSSGSVVDTEVSKGTKGAKGTKGGKGTKPGRNHGHDHAVLSPKKKVPRLPLDPEARSSLFSSTVWLHRELPDPTPPAKRLTQAFATDLLEASRAAEVRWSLVLAVLRARGDDGGTPADRAELDALAQRLSELGAARSGWQALVALEDARFAKEAVALARYNRAAGLWALVHGLEAAQERLEERILGDEKIDVYAGGRSDIEAGRIDVRVLVLLRYLRIAHGDVTVSSLFTGHGFFSRPGVPSAHMSGLAVDISMLNGKSITGNQEPGGLTDRAVQNILRLPAELQARQVISLLGFGGASFAMANHYDHIHVGF